jgi:DNA polymerase
MVHAWSTDSRSKRWTRRALYGGLLVENLVQGAARDVLVEAMLRLEHAGYRIAAHVHDEAILTIRKGRGDRDQIRRLMIESTPWMSKLDLPLDADVSPALSRYQK